MLNRKLLRDIGKHKTQFISIFLMAFLAVFIYTGIGGEWRGLQHTVDAYYYETKLADVFIMGEGFSEEKRKAVADIDGITDTELRTIIKASGKSSSNGVFENAPELSLFFVEKNDISKAYLVTGRDFDINDENGIWLDKRFCDANELKVGDTITLAAIGIEMEKEIKGIIYSPEFVFAGDDGGFTPNFKEIGYAYLSYKASPLPDHFSYSTLLLKSNNIVGLEEKVNTALGGKYTVYLEQKNHPSVVMFQNEILQHKMMGDVFPIVFLLVALLTMMTTMTRIISSQRVQIGTLKALGFRKSVISRHYISYGFWLSLAGSVLGGIIGPLTLPRLFYPSMSGFYTIPIWKPVYHISFLLVTLLVVVLCVAVTWLACSKQLKDTPAQTLRPKTPKIPKHSFIEKTALWKKIGFNTQWNLRDAARNKTRSMMAIIGVLGCTALLVCAFGMNDSMNILKKWQYEDINQFESKIQLEENVTDEQITAIIQAISGEAIMESSIELRSNGIKKNGSAIITDDVTLIQPTGTDKKPAYLPKDGISITTKMADVLGIGVGDTVEWHIYGSEKWVESKIAAVYRNPTMQGLTMTREVFEELHYSFKATSILTLEKNIESFDGISMILSTSAIINGWDDLTEAMMLMVYILIAGAAVLSIVVLYNLGLLSFTEMERDMATLKVMGMKTKKLRGLLLTQNIWFSIIGFLLGLPFGIWLIKAMTDSSGEAFDFPVELTITTLLFSFVITFGLSIFTSLLFSKKIKKLNMVESLKAIE